MKPLFDKTEFKKQMSKIFTMETESEKKNYQTKLRIQAEKEMRIIKTELLQGASSQNPTNRLQMELRQGATTKCVIPRHEVPKRVETNESNIIMKEFQEYLSKKRTPPNTPP
jgi:hypothetical protein